MVISVNPASGAVELNEPEDCERFHVEVHGAADPSELSRVLEAAGAGSVQDSDAVIGVDWVRGQVAGRVGHDWEDRFARMLAFAATKGWLRDDGTAIQAHVVWR
jgi:hypothetical protein